MINRSPEKSLEIYLFGSFEVFIDGVKLQGKLWQSRQVRSVFKVLVTRRGSVTTSEQLIEMLWPEDDPEITLRRLYVRVSQLRKLLKGNADFNPIRSVPGGYLFISTRTQSDEGDQDEHLPWVDVDAFEDAADQGSLYLEEKQLDQAVRALDFARQLYRGDYLAEDRYAEWTIAEKERLHERYLVVLTELAEVYAQQGFFRRSINLCQRVLGLDPWREAVFLRLMLNYYYAGDKVKALQTYAHCQEILRKQIGIEPDPHTTWLADQIQQGTLWSQKDQVTYPPPAYEGRLFEVPYSLGDTPFIGRDRELAWMLETWRKNPEGCIWISGEAGIGKTRLANAFNYALQNEGVEVIKLSALNLPGDLCDALLTVLNLPEYLSALEELSDDSRTMLSQLVKSDDDFHLDEDLSSIDTGQANKISTALLEFMLAKHEQLLICLDDVHALDKVSVDFLRDLIGQVGLLLINRHGELSPDHPLLKLRKDNDSLVQLKILSPWRLEDLEQLLHVLKGDEVLNMAMYLYDRSHGNPLFVIASLQHLFEEGILYVTTNGKWAQSGTLEGKLAPNIEQAIAKRLNLVPPDDRMVLDIMAVAGGEIDYEILQAVLGCEERALLTNADRLISKGLILEPRGYQSADLSLAHGLYGEVLYQTLPKARQRIFHRRIAEAMHASGRDLSSQASILAEHFFRGGEVRQASYYAREAGDHALHIYEPEQAWRHYQNALGWVDVLDFDGKLQLTARIKLGMAEAQRYLGAYSNAAQLYQEAIPFLEDEFKEGAIFQLFNVRIFQGEPLSVYWDLTFEFESLLAHQGDSWALALIFWSKSFVALILGDAHESRLQYAAGWRIARKLAARGKQMPEWIYHRAFSIIMRAHNQWGNYATSIYFAQKILNTQSRSTLFTNTRAVVSASLGESYFNLGDYPQAEDTYQQCYQLANQAQDPRLLAVAMLGLGHLSLARGNFLQAEDFAEQVLAMSDPPADLLRQMLAQLLKVCVAIKTGVDSEHQASLENLIQFARGMHAFPYVAICQVVMAELQLSVGNPDQAEVYAREGLEIAQRCRLKREIGAAKRYLAAAAVQKGEVKAGRDLAEEALVVAEAIQAPFEIGLCFRTRAALQTDPHKAVDNAHSALTLFEDLGADFESEQTRQLLESLAKDNKWG